MNACARPYRLLGWRKHSELLAYCDQRHLRRVSVCLRKCLSVNSVGRGGSSNPPRLSRCGVQQNTNVLAEIVGRRNVELAVAIEVRDGQPNGKRSDGELRRRPEGSVTVAYKYRDVASLAIPDQS